MDAETVAIAVGLVVGLAFSEVFGLAAGGLVVPGYIALFLDRPWDVAATLAAAALTWLIVYGISRFSIVYGKRRTVLMILVGLLLGAGMRAALDAGFAAAGQSSLLAAPTVIGFIVPGLIAIWIDRQGICETYGVLLTTSVVVRLVLVVIGMEIQV